MAGDYLIFAADDAYSVPVGYRAFVGRCSSLDDAKTTAWLALIEDDATEPAYWDRAIQYGWAQIVFGDEIIAEWWGAEWAPPEKW